MTNLTWLAADSPPEAFPPVDEALREPDGLLAAGGDLTVERLLAAYRKGIFPWYEDGQPVLWWSPDPRTVLLPDDFHISRSLKRHLGRTSRCWAFNRDFAAVIDACKAPRSSGGGTWITNEMRTAYCRLHDAGFAHSVGVYDGDRLVGGMYGLAIDRVFFGESMFSHEADASKMALLALVREMQRRRFALLDCQVHSSHLATLGARQLPRTRFIEILRTHCRLPRPRKFCGRGPVNRLKAAPAPPYE